jgi:hypothetical protein
LNGAALNVPAGVTVAAALIGSGSGAPGWRRTRLRDEARGLFCGIGVCFDCLVSLNGIDGVRSCLVEVRAGDAVLIRPGPAPAIPAPAIPAPAIPEPGI